MFVLFVLGWVFRCAGRLDGWMAERVLVLLWLYINGWLVTGQVIYTYLIGALLRENHCLLTYYHTHTLHTRSPSPFNSASPVHTSPKPSRHRGNGDTVTVVDPYYGGPKLLNATKSFSITTTVTMGKRYGKRNASQPPQEERRTTPA